MNRPRSRAGSPSPRLRAVLGGGQIALEEALLRDVLERKRPDPWRRLALVVPSRSVRLHFLEALPRLAGRALLGVEVRTVAGLAHRILEGAGEGSVEAGDAPLAESETIRSLLAGPEPPPGELSSLGAFARGPDTVRSTLRDLRDAGLGPEAIAAEGREERSLRPLVPLARALAEGFVTSADLARKATEAASRSAWLRGLSAVLYYGFYDLVGVQVGLLRAVAAAAPVTIFFPLRRGCRAFAFAERSLARIAGGLEVEEVEAAEAEGAGAWLERLLAGTGGGEAVLRERVEVASAGSPADEVAVAAKEVLRLREGGLESHEIAVVTRDPARHLPALREIFAEHRIPFASEEGPPLGAHPFAKAALALARLVGSDLPRRDVLDLVSSPAFEGSEASAASGSLGERITRRLGIASGEDWARLDPEMRSIGGRGEEEEDEAGSEDLSAWNAERLRLKRTVEDLRRGLGEAAAARGLPACADAYASLLERWLGKRDPSEEGARGALARILAEVRRVRGGECAFPSFASILERAVESAALPGPSLGGRGVRVLSPAAARGRTFEALVLLGLNEQDWPRRVPEDPLLPDDVRERLAARGRGFLPAKREAPEEDRLLFHLLLSSARRRALLVWSRRDERSRPAHPSWFLEEVEEVAGPLARIEVPGTLERRLEEGGLWSPRRRTPAEAALAALWAGADPLPLARAARAPRDDRKWAVPLLEGGLRFLEAIEDFDGDLARDGETGPIEAHWGRLVASGVSPTALEHYARCPFQYFARSVLGLAPLEDPEEVEGLGALEVGDLAHEILRGFYEGVVSGREGLPALARNLEGRLDAAAREVFRRWEAERPLGHPLLWEHRRALLLGLLRAALAEDVGRLVEEGFVPKALEAKAVAPLPEEALGLRARGILDRIDAGPRGEFRVVDYKFTLSAKPESDAGGFEGAAIRGKRLQPPIYLLLARALLGTEARGDATFLDLAPRAEEKPKPREPLPIEFWGSAAGKEFRRTLGTILTGIRAGSFPITPDEEKACRNCDFPALCRKSHFPTRSRAARSAAAKALAEIAEKELPWKKRRAE